MDSYEDLWEERGTDIDRLIFFSDAVFAIAMTLLVLGIKVAELQGGDVTAQLSKNLLAQISSILTFIFSFYTVANF